MRKFAIIAICAACAFVAAFRAPLGAQALPSAAEVVAAMDANRAFSSIAYEASMTIRSGGKERVKSMRAWAEGSEKAFVEFTNKEDLGTKFLKLGKDLWMYFPKEDDTVKISGHLLKEGMMGSDVTYEDAMESDALSVDYDAQVVAEESLDGRAVWKLVFTARTRAAKWEKRVMWVDRERFVALREEVWTRGGVLQRVIAATEVKRFGSRWYPTVVEMKNALKANSSTTFRIVKASFDEPIDPKVFTMENLTK